MKKTILISFLTVVICLFGASNIFADSNWTPVKGFEHNMNLYGKVLVNGTMVQSTDFTIAAFDDLDVCKGKAIIKMHDKNINFFMTISSNNDGEKLYLKLLDTKTGTEYKVLDSITFKSDTTIADKVVNAF